MGAPYSEDLRLRVLAAVDGGLGKTQVHRTFGLRAFMEQHQGRTLAQLSRAWAQAQGQQVSVKTFHKTLQRLGYTRKKRTADTRNATPKSAPLSCRS